MSMVSVKDKKFRNGAYFNTKIEHIEKSPPLVDLPFPEGIKSPCCECLEMVFSEIKSVYTTFMKKLQNSMMSLGISLKKTV